jgi:hypothetical protein
MFKISDIDHGNGVEIESLRREIRTIEIYFGARLKITHANPPGLDASGAAVALRSVAILGDITMAGSPATRNSINLAWKS